MGDMEEIVHCLTYLVKAMHSTRLVKDLRYDKEEGKVTIVYKNGHEKDVDVHYFHSDRAMVKKIIKVIYKRAPVSRQAWALRKITNLSINQKRRKCKW